MNGNFDSLTAFYLRLYRILASALQIHSLAIFWEIGSSPAPAKFLAGLSDLTDVTFSCSTFS